MKKIIKAPKVAKKTEPEIREQFTVHPGSGAFVCRILNIRYPNVQFTVTDTSDQYIYGAGRYHKEPISKTMCGDIYNEIAILNIVWQLSKGKIGEYIHG